MKYSDLYDGTLYIKKEVNRTVRFNLLYDNNDYAGIDACIKDAELCITSLYSVLPLRKDRSKSVIGNGHLGTKNFNILLYYLFTCENYIPEKITARLSYADRDNGNWLTSVPFYMDFPNHMLEQLPYTLIPHLYADKEYRTSVVYMGKENMQKFCEIHKDIMYLYVVYDMCMITDP